MNRRSPAPSPGSRRPVCRSGCTRRWSAPRMPARSWATSPGTPRRSLGGEAGAEAEAAGAAEAKARTPEKGEEVPREPTRLERQLRDGMTAAEMAAELPKACDTGTKRNAKGYKESWRGYKLHIDAADGDVPVSCILTSASLHDSQAAIPLSRMTALRVDHCYELMGRGLRLAGDRVPRLPDGARGDHRHQPATRRGAEGAPQERGAGAAESGPHTPRPRPLPAALQRRAGELGPEGLLRCPARPRPWARQGGLPPVLRRAGPDGGTADAAHHLTPSVPADPSATDAAPEGTARPAMRGRRPSGHQLRHSATPWPVQTPRHPSDPVPRPWRNRKACRGCPNRSNCARGSEISQRTNGKDLRIQTQCRGRPRGNCIQPTRGLELRRQ